MTDLTERLDAIQATLDAAVKEPWHLAGGNEWISPIGICIAPDDGGVSVLEGDFIAAAPADVAFLLDLARKQGAAIDAARAEAWDRGMGDQLKLLEAGPGYEMGNPYGRRP